MLLPSHRLVLPVFRPITRVRNMSAAASTTIADDTVAGKAAKDSMATNDSPLVMQLIVNEELLKEPGWTMGPMMAQAAHAATAIIAQTYSTPSTQRYIAIKNLPSMRKVVLQTSEPLQDLSKRLQVAAASSSNQDFPSHYLWIEEPEHIPTVLAIAPNTRPSSVKKILQKCTLLRA